jgi:hypothetical protein
MVVLSENDYFSLTYFSDISVIRYTRTERPYPSNENLEKLHEDIGPMLDRLGRNQLCLLVDMRSAPLNNSPGFEPAMARARLHLLRGFSRISVLVRTAVGALQARRYGREDAINVHVFQDEATAITFLRSLTVDAAAPRTGALDLMPASSERRSPQSAPGIFRRWETG